MPAVILVSTVPGSVMTPGRSIRRWAAAASTRRYAPSPGPRTYKYGGKMTDLYPSQTIEYVPIPVTAADAPVTTGVAYSAVPNGQPPSTWSPAVIVNSQTCWLLSGLTPGTYRKWCQVTAGTEVAVVDCGTLTIV